MDGRATRAKLLFVWRLLPIILVLLALPTVSFAQAPPQSFFEGRTLDDLRALASNPHNDVLLRRGAATTLVITLADEGRFDEADSAGREFAKNIDPAAIKHARAVRLRSHVAAVARALLGAILGIAALSLVAARHSVAAAVGRIGDVTAPVAFLFCMSGWLGGYLASSYENGSALPFVSFAACMLPLLAIFRVWGAVGSVHVAARAGRGVAAVTATLALGFLVVEYVNPAYLEGYRLESNREPRRARASAGVGACRPVRARANCSSIGSVIDTLFASAVLGGAVLAAVLAANGRTEPITVVSPPPRDPPDRGAEGTKVKDAT